MFNVIGERSQDGHLRSKAGKSKPFGKPTVVA
jgi:hypothetical protein